MGIKLLFFITCFFILRKNTFKIANGIMDSKNAINAKKHISPIITIRECSASNISVILLLLFHALNRKKNTGTNHMACSNLHIRFRLSFRNTFFFTLFPLFFYYFTPIKNIILLSFCKPKKDTFWNFKRYPLSLILLFQN